MYRIFINVTHRLRGLALRKPTDNILPQRTYLLHIKQLRKFDNISIPEYIYFRTYNLHNPTTLPHATTSLSNTRKSNTWLSTVRKTYEWVPVVHTLPHVPNNDKFNVKNTNGRWMELWTLHYLTMISDVGEQCTVITKLPICISVYTTRSLHIYQYARRPRFWRCSLTHIVRST